MKKILLCLALTAAAAVSANAQNRFSKNDWFIGAQTTNFGLSTSFHGGDGGSMKFNLGGMGGWFFSDKFAVDAMAGIDYAKARGFESNGSINFGAGVRYYPVANLFARLGYSGNVLWSGDVRSYLDAKVGYDIFLSEKVFFEPAVYFSKNINRSLNNAGTENILGASIGIGVRF